MGIDHRAMLSCYSHVPMEGRGALLGIFRFTPAHGTASLSIRGTGQSSLQAGSTPVSATMFS
jgi:hypothetical protein